MKEWKKGGEVCEEKKMERMTEGSRKWVEKWKNREEKEGDEARNEKITKMVVRRETGYLKDAELG